MRLLVFSAILAAGTATLPAAAQVYRWVDERGVVNYASVPPAGVQATRVATEASPNRSVDASPATTVWAMPRSLPPVASTPPGDVDRATLDAVGRALAARTRCSVGKEAGCAGVGHRDHVPSAFARYGPTPLTALRAP